MKIKKVTSNKRLKHYTIYLFSGVKIRTVQLTKDEFENYEYFTYMDWVHYLNFNNSYFI